ncbi:diacylglycerol kinase [Niabella ginsengisoli]|uniref:Diacylglycerol kinase family protein n=1 Tax=Niabella ginsengisoli TaxID=522298 RepID=A0ABS9SL51_9BACT|nr:diacylglycerol kinase family protein [Niabella ginsengisoli]MCH5599113.1 diacylglycerol kinase family protein [Niabella ginsengisoli]
MNAPFSIKKLIKSFGYAFSGLKAAIRSEQNFRVHLFSACVAIALGVFLHISSMEFVIIIICIGIVMAAELMNTTIEKLCDFISPQYHERIKIIKDLAAAAVLLVAIAALIVGLIIFLPRIFSI